MAKKYPVKPYPFQLAGVYGIEEFGYRALLADEPGLGKGGTLSSKILTPNGWTTYADIKVGDEVIGSDGKNHKVTGVFPRGIQQIYRVTFSDGFSTDVDGDHLWQIQTRNDRNRKTSRVLKTKDLYRGNTKSFEADSKVARTYSFNTGFAGKNGNDTLSIPMVNPVWFTSKTPEDIDPYLLGVYLGNGSMVTSTPHIYLNADDANEIIAWTRTQDQVRRIKEKGHCIKISFLGGELASILRKYKLAGKRSWEKFVPPEFMLGNPSARLKLIQGLMDTDGTPISGGGAEYSTSSGDLKDAMVFLVQSLGGTARVKLREKPKYSSKNGLKTGRPNWRVNIKLPANMPVFLVKRKADKHQRPTKYPPMRYIKNIEKIGKEKTICISVDSADHLYVTDNFIVTHNTVQALLCAYRNPKLFPIVVICPASAKWTWQRECAKFGFDAEVLEGETAKKGKLPTKKEIAIINYDILAGWMDKLKYYDPNLLIPDECHYASNIEALRTQLLMEICRHRDHIIGLSGTPMLSKPIQLFPMAHILRPDKFKSIMSYATKYCQPQIKYGKWDFGGVRKLKMGVLNRRITKYFMIRRLKTDVLDDLPQVTHTVIPLNLPKASLRQYEEAGMNFRGWLRGHDPSKMAGAIHAEALAKVNYLKLMAARLKMPQVIGWTDDLLQTGQKLIQFGIQVELVKELYKKFSPNSVIVNGSVVGRHRQDAIDRFNNDDSCNLFAGNIDAAGTNWSCTSASNVAAFELAWNPGVHNQAWQRCHGINRGQEGVGVNSYYLVARGTLEERVCELLQEKQTNINSIIDGSADAIDFSIQEKLLEAIRRGEVI